MNFNYKKFISSIHTKFKNDFSIEEVTELLSVNNDYERDSVHEKRLIINRLRFTGNKSGENFVFDKPFSKGVNMLLADNLKGKSSILKIIKFCLTGNSKIRDDVYSWLNDVFLEISINEYDYTIYINLSGNRQKSIFYKNRLSQILDYNFTETEIVFESNSNSTYVEEIENFFFKEFEFYNLQWTQKDSRKDRNEMHTSEASWKTYYNYLNLESKDSNVMFYGGQDELCYQMLLGLKLTYPINRLKVKKERREHENGLAKTQKGKSQQSKEELTTKINHEINVTKTSLTNLSVSKNILANNELLKNRSDIGTQINVNQNNIRINEKDILKQQEKIYLLRKNFKSNILEIDNLKSHKNKILKKINDLKEYLAIGIFFTNLDVEVCPHCNHTVDEHQKQKEKENMECMLCNHSVSKPLSDTETYDHKIKQYEDDIVGIDKQIFLYTQNNDTIKENGKAFSKELDLLKSKVEKLKLLESDLLKKYNEVGRLIMKFEQENSIANNRKLQLEKELAVLEYRIKEANQLPETIQNPSKYDKEIALLEHSINELKILRLNENKDIIKQLEKLILEELKDMGISGVEDVQIEENFKIKFKINQLYVSFDKVSEGEQLRAKLALYFGLIQLNIQHGYGRHPRFLIIDSPAKEEGDKHFIEGLTKVIEDVNNKFGNELQILICTAKRELENINVTGQKYVFSENEFLF